MHHGRTAISGVAVGHADCSTPPERRDNELRPSAAGASPAAPSCWLPTPAAPPLVFAGPVPADARLALRCLRVHAAAARRHLSCARQRRDVCGLPGLLCNGGGPLWCGGGGPAARRRAADVAGPRGRPHLAAPGRAGAAVCLHGAAALGDQLLPGCPAPAAAAAAAAGGAAAAAAAATAGGRRAGRRRARQRQRQRPQQGGWRRRQSWSGAACRRLGRRGGRRPHHPHQRCQQQQRAAGQQPAGQQQPLRQPLPAAQHPKPAAGPSRRRRRHRAAAGPGYRPPGPSRGPAGAPAAAAGRPGAVQEPRQQRPAGAAARQAGGHRPRRRGGFHGEAGGDAERCAHASSTRGGAAGDASAAAGARVCLLRCVERSSRACLPLAWPGAMPG